MSDHEEGRTSDEEKLNTIDATTIFKYRETIGIHNQTDGDSIARASTLLDDDDDLVLPRKKQTESIVFIEHSTYTDVESVGLQVWNGAILLAEFIIWENRKFENKQILEMGSGTGLVGIIAAKYSASVICTDVDDDAILKTIERNFQNNRESVRANFRILPFDFSKEWSADVEAAINDTDIIIASELIYDDVISKNLVEVLVKMLRKRPMISVYFSVEKRYVFTLLNQKIEAVHYEYFFHLLKQSLDVAFPGHKLNQIAGIPQYFYEYDRCKEAELWHLSVNE